MSALENFDCLSFSPPEKAPLSASPLLDCGNITCLPDLGAVGALFEGGLSDAVLACFILSTVNIVILLVTGAVIGRRNYQIISRTEALEMKIRSRGRGRNTHPWRGKENFDQRGSYLSLSDPDIFGTLAPSYPSFEYHQREANRCVEVELHPPTAGIVRSSVGVSPVVSTSRPDRRCPGISRYSTDLEGGHQSGVNRMCRLDTVLEEDSF